MSNAKLIRSLVTLDTFINNETAGIICLRFDIYYGDAKIKSIYIWKPKDGNPGVIRCYDASIDKDSVFESKHLAGYMKQPFKMYAFIEDKK